MRILITGGFGFVGGRLARHFQSIGHTAILGTGQPNLSPDWLPEAEVRKLHWHDVKALESACEGVDAVVHAAGMNAQDCAADPVAALAFNGVATARLVTAAIRAGVRRIIYLSTAHIYANPLVGHISEQVCPGNLHPYATSHLAGEQAVLWAAGRGCIEGIVLRLSNAFGAPVHKDANCWMLLVNDLCRQAVESGRMVLKSSGRQYRDFIALTEVSKAVSRLTTDPVSSSKHHVFNLGSGKSWSILDMAQLIQERCANYSGHTPVLERNAAMGAESSQELFFKIDRLQEAGIEISRDPIAEIDELLMFCNSQFQR